MFPNYALCFEDIGMSHHTGTRDPPVILTLLWSLTLSSTHSEAGAFLKVIWQ